MSQFFVLLSKAASQLLIYVLAKLSTQVQVYGPSGLTSLGLSLVCITIVSIVAFGPQDPGSNPDWFTVSDSNQKLSFYVVL